MEYLYWFLAFCALVLVSQYTLGPIFVWNSVLMPEKYQFNLMDSEEFLRQRSEKFHVLHGEIQRHNFICVGSSQLMLGKLCVYFSVYHHSEELLLCSVATTSTPTTNTTNIEFTQQYENGSVLDVSNAASLSVFPDSRLKLFFRFPDVNDFVTLLAYTEKLIAANKTTEKKIAIQRGKEFEALEFFLNFELRELINRAWVQHQVNQGCRRLTIKGVYLMTWKMIWPIKQLINCIEITRSMRALKKAAQL